MYESDQKTEKWKVEIQVELNDGTSLLGAVFVTPMPRISELLNDHRQFLPVLTSDGLIVHLRKTTIAKLVQLDQAVGMQVQQCVVVEQIEKVRAGIEPVLDELHQIVERTQPLGQRVGEILELVGPRALPRLEQ